MTAFVVLLRGVNVGGKNKLPMADFRDLLEAEGGEDVASYIQSGNAVLRHSAPADALAEQIAAAMQSRLNLDISVLVQTADEFRKTVSDNPLDVQDADPKTLHVWFLREPARAADTARLADLAADTERFALTTSAFFLHAPAGIGRSKLAANVEACLGVAATARNWRSIQKLGDMLADLG